MPEMILGTPDECLTRTGVCLQEVAVSGGLVAHVYDCQCTNQCCRSEDTLTGIESAGYDVESDFTL